MKKSYYQQEKSIILKILLFFFFIFFSFIIDPARCESTTLNLIKIDDAINPIVAERISQALELSKKQPAQALIIQLDTPGGLDKSMRIIIKDIIASEIPVIVYVAPGGARAASAGVFITLVAHVAAMAPGTNIGSAHPVMMGLIPAQKTDETMEEKIINDSVAYIRSLAERRGRNADWAESAVRDNSNLTAHEALELGVIDAVCPDLQGLLAFLEGFKIKIGDTEITLATKEAQIKEIKPNFKQRVLTVISNPDLAYILLMLGLLGLFFEISHPGVILPGLIGAISLILAFYSLQTLPINYAGLLLILLSIIFFILEIKVVSFGMLTIGGIISLVIGSLMLIDSPVPYLQIHKHIIFTIILTVVVFVILLIYLVTKAYRKKPLTGISGMVGETGVVKSTLNPEGSVFVHGEIWKAISPGKEILAGSQICIKYIDGLTLIVEPVEEKNSPKF